MMITPLLRRWGLNNLHAQLPDLNASGKLKCIHVGNEIDAYLGDDAVNWARWRPFFCVGKAKIKALGGADVVATGIVRYAALRDADKRAPYLDLVPELDSAVFPCYPLDDDFRVRPRSTMATDFGFKVAAVGDKTILLRD